MAGDQVQIPFRDHVDYRFNRIEDDLGQLKADVKALETSRAELAGKADAQVVNRVLLISMASLLLAGIGLALRFLGI